MSLFKDLLGRMSAMHGEKEVHVPHADIDREKRKKEVLKKHSLQLSIKKLENREISTYDKNMLVGHEIKYEDLLSCEQKKALTAIDGRYLVIAGAGSGKTRTVVYRTALLLDLGIDPQNILMITFTKKAASEMKERVEDLLQKEIKDLLISTFHSFCAKMITENRNYFGIEKLNILEETEKISIIKELIKEKHLKRIKKIPFPSVEKIIQIIDSTKNKKNIPENLITEKENTYMEELQDVIRCFYEYKKHDHLLEFDDLIDIFVEGLERDPELKNIIQSRYKYIIVDEYQDSNAQQRRLLMDLVGKTGNLMVVGDDYQSIYGFRGGNFENILRFYEDFPGSYLIKLEKNYRSSDEIISYCNRIAKKFNVSYDKVATGTGVKHDPPKILSFKDEKEESSYIINKIKELHDKNIKYKDIAILYRNRAVAKHIFVSLKEAGIPFITKELDLSQDENTDKITMSTVHSSKGLEWDHVFLPTMMEGIFPCSMDPDVIEEEKRLYYVGCSRAKISLYITYPRFFYERSGFFSKKSRFLNY